MGTPVRMVRMGTLVYGDKNVEKLVVKSTVDRKLSRLNPALDDAKRVASKSTPIIAARILINWKPPC